MKSGIVIVNYNDYESTIALINNIKDYKNINKIVVVDNSSTDDSYSKLSKLDIKKLKVIKSNKNNGYSSAINIGSKYLIDLYKECYIIVSNSDIIIKDEKEVDKILKGFNKSNIGVVAPNIIEKGTLNRGWKLPSPIIDSLLNIIFIHRYLRKIFINYNNKHYLKEFSKVEAVSGCFFIIDSIVLKKIDYLDENVFLYYEENILGNKLKKKKYNLLISNYASVIHNHSVSIDKSVNKINKYKILKKSQYYYHITYNKANIIERFLLKITNNLSMIILYIVYKIKEIFNGR